MSKVGLFFIKNSRVISKDYTECKNIAIQSKSYGPLLQYLYGVLHSFLSLKDSVPMGTNCNEKTNRHNSLFVFHRQKKFRLVRNDMRVSKNNKIFITE